ncbi:MAG: serine hydrolase [Defluviitaleaceae bacterium]|nr:serine hydrolase [Defluviitaleaceae bacterium]
MKKFILCVLAILVVFNTLAFANETNETENIFIPWTFEVYTEADFRSAMVGQFDAQSVTIVERGENHWILIDTPRGAGWVNTLYSPALCVLGDFFAPMGRNISVFYKNLDTGFTYIHNPDRIFFGASLSKSNHALYSYMLAERGFMDMYEVHTFTEADAWGGTGIMQFMPRGTEFTTRELLGLSMRESDNVAFRMLVRMFANAELSYQDFVREIGADSRLVRDVISQNIHARDAGLFMYNIFNYIEGESLFGHYLKYDLLNTAQTSHPYFTRWEASWGLGGPEVNVQMIKSDYPLARKYGWSGGAFHDAGIIYAPSPYILVILSNMERGAHAIFEDISWFVQDFNGRHFVSPTQLDAPIKGPETSSRQTTQPTLNLTRDTYDSLISANATIPAFRPLTTPIPELYIEDDTQTVTKAEIFASIPHKVFAGLVRS